MTESDVEILEHDGYFEARYLGSYSLERYKTQMERSVRACEEKKIRLLLVDIRDLENYAPTTRERFEIGRYGAEISRNLDRVAALGTPDQIEPDPFASLVARNRGLMVRGFTDPKAALEWLLKG